MFINYRNVEIILVSNFYNVMKLKEYTFLFSFSSLLWNSKIYKFRYRM